MRGDVLRVVLKKVLQMKQERHRIKIVSDLYRLRREGEKYLLWGSVWIALLIVCFSIWPGWYYAALLAVTMLLEVIGYHSLAGVRKMIRESSTAGEN